MAHDPCRGNRQRLLINLDGQPSHIAGVTPDYFSADGQLWGNPLYDWDYHKATGYRWWIERIQHAAGQTPLVRIDHFREFEVFWSVPYGETTARNGEWITGKRMSVVCVPDLNGGIL